MSRIDDLIAQHCPNGVIRRRLSTLGIRNKGTAMTASKMKSIGGGGPVRIFAGGNTVADVSMDAIPEKDIVKSPSIIVKSRGNIGFAYYGNLFTHKNEIWSYTIADDEVEQKFVYYYLLTQVHSLQALARATSVKIPQLSVKDTDSLQIPVPPLEVQREIVRILDHFTALEAELEAELEARRVQFDHYRREQMTFGEDIELVDLGALAEVRSGWGFPKSEQGLISGDYPFYKVSDMNLPSNTTSMVKSNNYVSEAIARNLGTRPAPAGTVIFPKIGAAVATNKKRILSVPAVYDNNVMGIVPGSDLSSRFLYHWFQTFNLSSLANYSGAVPSIRKSEAEKVQFPSIAMEEQERIAYLLDSFESLVNDINIGLPAELAARRKQYEYYRDKLLTFEEAPA